MPDPNFEKRIEEIKAQHEQHVKSIQSDNAYKINTMQTDFSLEIEKLLTENRGQTELLNKYKAENKTKIRELLIALLRIRTQRDKILLAVSWTAIAVFVIIAFCGVIELFSKVLTFAALAGFIGTIIFIRKSLKSDQEHLEMVIEGSVPSESIWTDHDARSERFLVFGFICMFLLVLSLVLNAPPKDPVIVPAVLTQQQIASGSQAGNATQSKADSSPASITPLKPRSAVKPGGNGGNFTGGVSQD